MYSQKINNKEYIYDPLHVSQNSILWRHRTGPLRMGKEAFSMRDLIAHPEKAQELPDQAEIEFIEKDFEERQVQEVDKKVLVIAPSSV